MKRINNIYNQITDVKTIMDMYNKKVKITTKNKQKIEQFNDYYTINITKLENALKQRTYQVGKYNIFLIEEPKIRVIMSQNIIDKLTNHLVAQYFLINILEKDLIEENIATRIKKGTKYGIDLTKKYINTIKKETENIYFLKFDISKYFYSIDHDILKNLINKKIKDKDALNLLYKIIDSTNQEYINKKINKLKDNKLKSETNQKRKKEIENIPIYNYNKGLPIGNMTSQILAIYYLNELDHFIKEKLNIKYYIRYMDDGILIHHSKAYLKYCLKEITKIVQKYKLELNKKTQINHIKNGLDFLGFKFYLKNNKVVLKVRNSTKKRFKRKSAKYKKMLYNKTITKKEYNQYISSYMGHLQMGNTFHLVRKNIKEKTRNQKRPINIQEVKIN